MYDLFHNLQKVTRIGDVEQYKGLQLVSQGPPQTFVGEICEVLDSKNKVILQAQVAGFEHGKVHLLPFSSKPLTMGLKIRGTGKSLHLKGSNNLLGQVLDALGNPLNKTAFEYEQSIPMQNHQINPLHRAPINFRIPTGIQALDILLPLGRGQRIGIFAGSGVGKSKLISIMAKKIESEVLVIALIGERGREVNDFIQNNLDEVTRKKSVVIVSCSDDFAVKRRQALYTAHAIAEYFCNQGKHVSLFVDSITRFAMAQREIGLGLGEVPTARGYTPSVFSLLPELVERAGNFIGKGSITAIYTVLVEGDDFNEPIADTMRSLLDGHIILTRELAQQGHYPAIDILQSVSRLRQELVSKEEDQCIKKVIALLLLYKKNKELIELGAYQSGKNKDLDYALYRIDSLQKFLHQGDKDGLPIHILFKKIQEILK
jgi:flagellum-specific ATP synthase